MAPLQALPLLVYAVAFAFGSFAHVRLPTIAAAAIIVLALAGSLHAWNRRVSHDHVRLAMVLLVGATTGFLLSSFAATNLGRHDSTIRDELADRQTRVIVVLEKIDSERARLEAQAIALSRADKLAVPANARLRAAAVEPLADSLFTGCLLQLRGPVRPRTYPANPGDFDYGFYLRRHGFSATMRSVAVRAACPQLTFSRRPLASMRVGIENAIVSGVRTPAARSMLSALVLGDRSALDDETREAFSRTGLAHVLAVSGLHVLIVGMSINRAIRFALSLLGISFFRSFRIGAFATLVVLAVYVGITGAAASSVRAAVMTAGLLWQGASQRPPVSLNSLGGAAIVLMVRNPLEFFDAGFQLSFSAVFGLVLLSPVIVDGMPVAFRNNRVGRFAGQSVAASIAATAGTLPFLVIHFGVVPLAGVLLNIVAIPLTMVILAAGIGIAAIPLDGLLVLLGAVATSTTDALFSLAQWGSEALGWMMVVVAPGTGLHVCAIALASASLVVWANERARLCLGALAMSCAVCGNALQIARMTSPRLRVTVFAVGHGDTIAIETPNRKWVLVDAGDSSGGYEPVVRSVLPFLRRAGVHRLEALVLTHPDRDHTGGAASVLRRLTVKQLLATHDAVNSSGIAPLVRLADSAGTEVVTVSAGQILEIDPAVRVLVLSPPHDGGWDDNDRSIVLKVVFGATSVLLTGDIERRAESVLATHWGSFLQSCAIKVPHHGSRTSSTLPLVRNVTGGGEAIAIISSGGRYGLPSSEVTRRWEREGAEAIITADAGAVTVRLDGRKCQVER